MPRRTLQLLLCRWGGPPCERILEGVGGSDPAGVAASLLLLLLLLLV